ncbi:MAG: ECF transporter S component [Ruminococcaceae bacterium]|nr:ECF transporter S component [Oscillospiraceae bacterium]
MKNRKLLYSLYASLFAALVFVATMIIKIPTLTGGYMNIGDGMVLLCGFILGPVWGALAAGIGSMLADLVGYPIYAIATFLIKALMAVVAYFLAKFLKTIFKKRRFIAYTIAGFAAELIMIGGYFVFEAVFMSYGLGAVVSVLPNVLQGVVGIAVGVVLMAIFDKTKLIEKMMRKRDK